MFTLPVPKAVPPILVVWPAYLEFVNFTIDDASYQQQYLDRSHRTGLEAQLSWDNDAFLKPGSARTSLSRQDDGIKKA